LSKKLILWTAARHENGFSTTADTTPLTGREGIAVTILRPAGTGEFDGQRLDVVSEGAFIDRGVKIRIIRTEGRRIVVEPVKQSL
jgi:membrane-bound serine protease (ClpP class)